MALDAKLLALVQSIGADIKALVTGKLSTAHAGTGGTAHADVVAGGASGFMTGADKTKLNGIANNATANTGTVTGVTGTAPIVSSGGTAPAISINAATPSAAGSMSATDKSKLDGVATGATANSTDANLRDRSTHTGTQLASTISDFSEAVDDRVNALIVVGSGMTKSYNDTTNVLTLDATGGGGGGTDPWERTVVQQNYNFTQATFADIASWTLPADTGFQIEADLMISTPATANMPRLQFLTGTANALDLYSGEITMALTATTNQITNFWGTTAVGTHPSPVGTAPVAAVPFLAKVRIVGHSNAGGLIRLQAALETAVAAGATGMRVHTGSEIRFRTYGASPMTV